MRTMTTQLIKHERIKTTWAKAMELRRPADKMITLAKKATEHSRKGAQAWVQEDAVLPKLFDELGPRFAGRYDGRAICILPTNVATPLHTVACLAVVDPVSDSHRRLPCSCRPCFRLTRLPCSCRPCFRLTHTSSHRRLPCSCRPCFSLAVVDPVSALLAFLSHPTPLLFLLHRRRLLLLLRSSFLSLYLSLAFLSSSG